MKVWVLLTKRGNIYAIYASETMARKEYQERLDNGLMTDIEEWEVNTTYPEGL